MYKVKVNTSKTFEIDDEHLQSMDVIETSDHTYHIIDKHQSVQAKVLQSDYNSKTYKVQVNNSVYDVVISTPLDQQIEHMGFALGSSKQVNSIKAPMPGLILEMNVAVGDDVQENDTLLILEAMKMENVITSPRAGRIKSIEAQKGNAVEKNQLLIEFE